MPVFIAVIVVFGGTQIGRVIADPQPPTARAIAVVIGIAAIDTVIVALMWRSFRSAVITDRDGVTVKNVVRNYRVPWSDVAGFTLGETAYESCIGFLNRSSGRSIPLHGVRGARSWRFDKSAEARRLVAALNDDLTRSRAEG